MGRLFVFTLGFSEHRVPRRLVGANVGDGVLCITVSPIAPGARSAYESIRVLLARSGLVDEGLVEVDVRDFSEAVFEIARIVLGKARGRMIVFDLSGGMRVLVVAALMAAIAVSRVANTVVYVVSESGDFEVKIDSSELNSMRVKLSPEEYKLLSEVAREPGLSDEELARRLNVSPKTVANRVSELSRMSLIARRGRGGGVYPLGWGKLALLTHEDTSVGASSSGT